MRLVILDPDLSYEMTDSERSAVKEAWHKRGFSYAVWVDGPGQVWPDFVHATDELVMVLEGQVEFEFGGALHRPKPGQELLIPAGTRHTVRNAGNTQSVWLYGYKAAAR